MSHKFNHREYADMILVYGFCNGSAIPAVNKYQRRFPNWRFPDRKVFQKVLRSVGKSGIFLSVRTVSEWQRQENIMNIIKENPNISTRQIANKMKISHTNGLKPFHIQPVQHSQNGHALGQNFVNLFNAIEDSANTSSPVHSRWNQKLPLWTSMVRRQS